MAYALRDIHGRTYPLGIKLQIGSDPGNQIALLDPQVAPFHATLWEQQGCLFLQDGSGGSATFVNQALVQGTATLRMGDQLAIGGTLFTVVDPNAQPAVLVNVSKKPVGCMRWLMIGAAIFMAECLCLSVVGFFVYNTDVEIRGGIQDLNEYIFGTPDSTDGSSAGTDGLSPEVLSLTDSSLVRTWIGGAVLGNDTGMGGFSQHDETTVDALTPSGAAVKTSFVIDTMQQNSPEWASYILIKKLKNGAVVTQMEKGIVKGVLYSGSPTCESSPDPNAGENILDSTPKNILTNRLTGHVKRVETGVTINGVLTDRYELKSENFAMPEAVVELKSGSLYRARDGGYLVRLEYVAVIKPQSWAVTISEDYSATETSQVTYRFDRTYAPGGTLAIKVPEACKNATAAAPATASQATQAPSVKPTPTQAVAVPPSTDNGSVLFEDDFSNANSGWYTFQSSDSLKEYFNGSFHIKVDTASNLAWTNPDRSFQNDISIDVDATKVGGPDLNSFGIICRYQDVNNFYYLFIASDGYAGIEMFKNGDDILLTGDTLVLSAAIKQGAATNRIGADCVGNTLTLYANGEQIVSVTDSSFSGGDVGLLAGAYDTPGVDILFDNFIVYKPVQ